MKRPDFPSSARPDSSSASKGQGVRVSEATSRRRVVRHPDSTRRESEKTRSSRRRASASTKLDEPQSRSAVRDARKARKEFERREVRRFTARVRRRRQAWFIAILAMFSLVLFVVIGVFSPVMRVEKITITGTSRVDPESISRQLADQIGVPLPLVDVSRIEGVLRRQNLVESYSIESRPPHDLILHLVEREPVAYMPAGTAFVLADAAGVTLETAPDYPGGFPLLHVPGDVPTGPAFESAVRVLRTVPSELRDRISDISATTTDDVTFVLGDTAQRVFWGSADDAAAKSRALEGLLANWPPGTAREYDVSAKDNVVVR